MGCSFIFESFHHCADHQKLIQYIDQIVNKNGKLIFAAEYAMIHHGELYLLL